MPERIIDLARRDTVSTFIPPMPRENSTLTEPQRNTAETVVSANKIKVRIELPITYRHPNPRRFVITMPKDMNVGRLRTNLAKEFQVKKEEWRVVAVDHKNAQHVLDDKEKLNEIQPEKRKRLYFYPNILR